MRLKLWMLIPALSLAIVSASQADEAQEKGSMADPAMEAMMEKYKEFSTPGDNHQSLNALIGKWNGIVQHWMSPDGDPQESTGTSESQWIMNGRFVQQTFSGESMGAPFEGMGIIGYDNLTKEYNTIWLDNMGTGIMKGTGIYNSASKKIAENGQFSCPMIGGNRAYRAVTTLIDDDHYKYETFMNDEDGNEFRAVLINYERQGSDAIAGNVAK